MGGRRSGWTVVVRVLKGREAGSPTLTKRNHDHSVGLEGGPAAGGKLRARQRLATTDLESLPKESTLNPVGAGGCLEDLRLE